MNTPARGFRVSILLALSVIVSASVVFGAPPAPEVNEPNDRPAAISEAVRLFAEGKDDAGAKRLRESCWSKEGSPEFTAEYLANFAFVAVSLQECGKTQEAERVAQSVLAEIERTSRHADFANHKERKKDLLRRSAYVHAKVLRDFEAAGDLLQQVAQLDPEDAEAGKEAGRARENARQYGKQKKGGK